MVKPPLRRKSIGFKVSEEECAQLETAAQADGRTLGEWCREVVLASASAAERRDPALAEIVGVRLLLVNVLGPVAAGEKVTPEKFNQLLGSLYGSIPSAPSFWPGCTSPRSSITGETTSMNRSTSVALILFLLLLPSIECESRKPTLLCDNFHSYQTVDDVRAQLEKSGEASAWKEESKATDPGDRRPPYKFVYLSGPFKLSGFDGTLKLTFFDGRLMQTQFSPRDSNNYLATMRQERSTVPERAGQEVTTDRRTKFRFDASADGNLIFTWYDPRLETQWRKWVADNS